MNNRCQGSAALVAAAATLFAVALLASCAAPPQGTAATDSAGSTAGGSSASPSAPNSAPGTELGHINSSSQPPVPPSTSTAAATNSAQTSADAKALATQCDALRADIREAQSNERLAPTTSVDEDIVAAREAKDDQRIAGLQLQYDQLGCPSAELPATHTQTAQPPPAPGAHPP